MIWFNALLPIITYLPFVGMGVGDYEIKRMGVLVVHIRGLKSGFGISKGVQNFQQAISILNVFNPRIMSIKWNIWYPSFSSRSFIQLPFPDVLFLLTLVVPLGLCTSDPPLEKIRFFFVGEGTDVLRLFPSPSHPQFLIFCSPPPLPTAHFVVN